jgi:hypothetical protein
MEDREPLTRTVVPPLLLALLQMKVKSMSLSKMFGDETAVMVNWLELSAE